MWCMFLEADCLLHLKDPLFFFLLVGQSLSIHGAEKRVQIYQRRSAASHQLSQRPSVVRHSSFPQVGQSIKMEASSSGSVVLPALIGKPVTHQPGKNIWLHTFPGCFMQMAHAMQFVSSLWSSLHGNQSIDWSVSIDWCSLWPFSVCFVHNRCCFPVIWSKSWNVWMWEKESYLKGASPDFFVRSSENLASMLCLASAIHKHLWQHYYWRCHCNINFHHHHFSHLGANGMISLTLQEKVMFMKMTNRVNSLGGLSLDLHPPPARSQWSLGKPRSASLCLHSGRHQVPPWYSVAIPFCVWMPLSCSCHSVANESATVAFAEQEEWAFLVWWVHVHNILRHAYGSACLLEHQFQFLAFMHIRLNSSQRF